MNSISRFPPLRPGVLKRARRGRRRAFAELVEPVAPVLHGLILQIVEQPLATHDVFQEVLASAFNRPETWPDDLPMSVWLLRRGAEAAARRRKVLEVEWRVAEKGPKAMPAEVRRHLRGRDAGGRPRGAGRPLGRALTALPRHHRLLVFLRFGADFSVRDTGLLFEIDPADVSRALFQAKEAVRDRRAGSLPVVDGCIRAREAWDWSRDGEFADEDVPWLHGHLRYCRGCLDYKSDVTRLEQRLRGHLREQRVSLGALRAAIDASFPDDRVISFLRRVARLISRRPWVRHPGLNTERPKCR